jgi:hypothetical protein
MDVFLVEPQNQGRAEISWGLLGILASHELNPQPHKYRCSFHPIVFHGYRIQGNVCVLTSYSQSKDTPR